MEVQPDPRQLSRFLVASAVMIALFVAASFMVATIAWLLGGRN
jgi:hypothetical protein